MAWSSLLLSDLESKNFFTHRIGGVSLPPYDSLNLGLTTQDDSRNVTENRKRVEEEFGVQLTALARQVHGDVILVLRKDGPLSEGHGVPEADAIVSNIPGKTLAMFFADCLPLFLYDPIQ